VDTENRESHYNANNIIMRESLIGNILLNKAKQIVISKNQDGNTRQDDYNDEDMLSGSQANKT